MRFKDLRSLFTSQDLDTRLNSYQRQGPDLLTQGLCKISKIRNKYDAYKRALRDSLMRPVRSTSKTFTLTLSPSLK